MKVLKIIARSFVENALKIQVDGIHPGPVMNLDIVLKVD